MGILQMINDVNCNNCACISLTEEEQVDTRESHICTHYNKRVFHNDFHSNPNPYPWLFPCLECVKDSFKYYKEAKGGR